MVEDVSWRQKMSFEKLTIKDDVQLGIYEDAIQFALDNDDIICYHAGMKPAVGKLPTWWQEIAERFMPEKQSRLGTRKERIAFLGLLIKYLIVEKGYTLNDVIEKIR